MVFKRKELIDRLEASGKDFIKSLALFTADEATMPPGPNEWSAREIAIHQRDTEEQVFLLRTVRALKNDHTLVDSFVQEEWSQAHPAEGESLTKIIADFRTARRKLIRLLRATSSREWEAYAVHPKLGKLSVGVMAEFNYSHTLNHLAQLIDIHEKAMLKKINE